MSKLTIGGQEFTVQITGMGGYRKKPIVINAVQIEEPFEVETLEGVMRGNPGDWLIVGVKGEMYPCKADVFAETYEAIA